MGKLNIAHHKSYHPYRRDNIERVRADEEAARIQQDAIDGKIALADSEARIGLLRAKAGLASKSGRSKGKEREDDTPVPLPELVIRDNEHINLFADLEQQSLTAATKLKKKVDESERGVALAPSEKDLKPWYSSRNPKQPEESLMRRDARFKSMNDPLATITKSLAMSSTSLPRSRDDRHRPRVNSAPASSQESRLDRESSERQRAMALIARKRREAADTESNFSSTPASSRGYNDMYNKTEVEYAKSRRESWRDQAW